MLKIVKSCLVEESQTLKANSKFSYPEPRLHSELSQDFVLVFKSQDFLSKGHSK